MINRLIKFQNIKKLNLFLIINYVKIIIILKCSKLTCFIILLHLQKIMNSFIWYGGVFEVTDGNKRSIVTVASNSVNLDRITSIMYLFFSKCPVYFFLVRVLGS